MVSFAGADPPFAATATPVALSAKPSVTAPAISLLLRMYFLSVPDALGPAVGQLHCVLWEKSFQRGSRVALEVITGVQPSGSVRTARARWPARTRKVVIELASSLCR